MRRTVGVNLITLRRVPYSVNGRCAMTPKRRERPVANRVLLRAGHVLSMDPAIGDVFGGDVLVEDDRIAAVGSSVEAGDAEVIDATGCIVMPGLIDSHRHT